MSGDRKQNRLAKGMLVGVIAVLLCLALWRLREQAGLSEPSDLDRGRVGETGGASSAKGIHGAGEDPKFRVVADETTSTGRVVTVSKNGVEKRVTLPTGVLVSPEDLEALAFDTPQPTGPLPKPQISVNSHLYFYGLVVDERTNALAGALINASSQVYENGTMQWHKLQLYSEADGRFTIDVPSGQALVLNVSKKPDYIDPPERRFKYGLVQEWEKHTPNVAVPVLFVLHRKKPSEPLFAFQQNYRTPNTGEPSRVDLTTGKLVKEGGDLIISVNCPEPYSEIRHFPWRLSVEAVGGGLVEIPSSPLNYVSLRDMHEAPETGYETGFRVEYKADSQPFRVQHEGMFYVASRNGQVHAKIYFRMNTSWDERGVPFRIEAMVNTNGSRNLQTPFLK